MQLSRCFARAGTIVLATFASVFATNTPGQTLRQVTKFDLPGPGGKRFDYLTIGEDDRYLLSAHLAAGQTYVIALDTNNVIGTVTDTHARCGRRGVRAGAQEVLHLKCS